MTWAAGVQDAWREPLVVLISPDQLLQAGPAHALHKAALHLRAAPTTHILANESCLEMPRSEGHSWWGMHLPDKSICCTITGASRRPIAPG